jgi:hypothetical protein
VPDRPLAPGLSEAVRVAVRVGWRLSILSAFALAGARPFWPTLATLLVLAAGLCVAVAAAQREWPLAATLSHWDEAAFYGCLSRAILLAGPASGPG